MGANLLLHLFPVWRGANFLNKNADTSLTFLDRSLFWGGEQLDVHVLR